MCFHDKYSIVLNFRVRNGKYKTTYTVFKGNDLPVINLSEINIADAEDLIVLVLYAAIKVDQFEKKMLKKYNDALL